MSDYMPGISQACQVGWFPTENRQISGSKLAARVAKTQQIVSRLGQVENVDTSFTCHNIATRTLLVKSLSKSTIVAPEASQFSIIFRWIFP